MRPDNRALDQLRDVSFEAGANAYAEGSCLAKFGGTHVLCTASIDAGVPRWLKGKGRGWVTAEYGMLPRSTHTRNSREAARGENPMFANMAAVSCGIVDGECRLDLEYTEDSAAQADANFVLTDKGGIIEVQASAEDTPFTADEMNELTRLATKGIRELCVMQQAAIK